MNQTVDSPTFVLHSTPAARGHTKTKALSICAMDIFFYLFKDKNSIQLSDNFFILGWIADRILGNYPKNVFPSMITSKFIHSILGRIIPRILGNYPTKDRFVIQKMDKFGK